MDDSQQTRSNGRSVNDFSSESALRQALSTKLSAEPEEEAALSCSPADNSSSSIDWMIPNDPPAEKTIDQEMKRLLVLKSYMILDAEIEPVSRSTFDGLVSVAKTSLGTTCGLISLVDLGRQWYLAKTCDSGGSEASRNNGLCPHAVLTANDPIFVVTDATQDDRFRNNPLVTGDPHMRFYAGVPLIVPEGFKIGVLCVTDTKPRPGGLSEADQINLMTLGKLVVDALVNHRTLYRQREQLRLAAQASAKTAHSLLTPLTGVQLSLSLLRDDGDLQAKMSSAQRECLATADSCVTAMEACCENLHHNGRRGEDTTTNTATDPTPCSTSTFDVRSLVPRLYSLTKEMSSKHQTTITISVDPSVPASIKADKGHVTRAAMSLISQAVSIRASSSVTLTLRLEEDRLLRLECCDSGPTPTASEYERMAGTGEDDVALEALRIQKLGGTSGVTCRNDGDKATSIFWLGIPLLTPPQVGEKQGASLHASKISPLGPTRTALVIDDSQVVRKVLCRALSKLNFDVFQAEDGLAGLKLLKQNSYNLVLCDFLMPLMDGMDCIREYREWERQNTSSNIRQFICGMSAHASKKDVEAAFRLGMDAYRPKPVNLNDLKMLSESLSLESDEMDRKEVDQRPFKRPRLEDVGKEACLVAADAQTESQIRQFLREQNVQVVVAADGDEILRLLKFRNWTAVFLDGDLEGVDGIQCVQSFRLWEQKNRVYRQHNIFLMSSGNQKPMSSAVSSSISLVHVPSGADGALAKPLCSVELSKLIRVSEKKSTDCQIPEISAADIVTR